MVQVELMELMVTQGDSGVSGDSGTSGTDGVNGISGINIGAGTGKVPEIAVVSGESVLVNGPFGVSSGSSAPTKVVSLSDDHEFGGFNAKTITVDVLQSLRNDDGSQVDPSNISFLLVVLQ